LDERSIADVLTDTDCYPEVVLAQAICANAQTSAGSMLDDE